MGAHTTAEEREEIIARFHSSGLTQREFCETEDITVGALRSWLYKRRRTRVKRPRFVEVTPSGLQTQTTSIELHLGELRVVLPMTLTDARIVDLIVALEGRMRLSK